MANPVVTKLDNMIRGDTPLLVFPIKVNNQPYDLTGWTAKITITANSAPSSNGDALVDKATCDIDENEVSYQITTTVSDQFVVGQQYYGDIELSKSPETSNTFTPVRFSFKVVTDYGV